MQSWYPPHRPHRGARHEFCYLLIRTMGWGKDFKGPWGVFCERTDYYTKEQRNKIARDLLLKYVHGKL